MVRLSIRNANLLSCWAITDSTEASTVSLKDSLQNMLSSSLNGTRSFSPVGAFCAHNARLKTDFYAPSGHARGLRRFCGTWAGHRNMGALADTLHIYRQVFRSSKAINFALIEISTFRLPSTPAVTICPTERRRYHWASYDALASALLLRRLADEPTQRGQLRWLFFKVLPPSLLVIQWVNRNFNSLFVAESIPASILKVNGQNFIVRSTSIVYLLTMPDLPKIVYFGPMPSAYLAYNIFNRSIYAPAAVAPQPDRRQGRGKRLQQNSSRSFLFERYPTRSLKSQMRPRRLVAPESRARFRYGLRAFPA